MLRCYITDRKSCGGDLMTFVRRAVRDGLDYIQLREKDLAGRALVELAREVVHAVEGSPTRVFVNSRADVAVAAHAHGVHLPADSPPPRVFKPLLVSVACHFMEDARRAEDEGADFVLFSPVFESPGKGAGTGVHLLAEVCKAVNIPVLALGGVNGQNAAACVRAGAAGIAGIRAFQVP